MINSRHFLLIKDELTDGIPKPVKRTDLSLNLKPGTDPNKDCKKCAFVFLVTCPDLSF